MKKIYYFTNIFPHYRKPIWRSMLESDDFNIKIFYSKDNPEGIKEIRDNETNKWLKEKRINQIKGFWFLNKILFWQSSVLKRCLFDSFDVVIVLGDMYLLSNWLIALICKIKRKKVIFWSHGLYGNEGLLKKVFRLVFYKLADYHLVYEKRGKKLLINNGFKEDKIKVIYNSLNYHVQKDLFIDLHNNNKNSNPFKFFGDKNLPVLFFSGRLSKSKKIHLLIEAFKELNLKKQVCNLLIVGEGPVKNDLLIQAKSFVDNRSIFFYGECYNEKILASFFFNSICTISPGNIGLTGIHSFSYGTPVITHDNLNNQMPEVESIIDGVNGFFFNEDNINSLVQTINKVLNSNVNYRTQCRNVVDNYYNSNFQMKILKDILNA